jgi:glycosyltransferase involved in cell wall biosynthesis
MNGPKAQIYKAACNYLKENRVCAIIATGDPFVLFHYASKLSKKFGIPWIADYRDPWSQDIHIQKKFFQKKWAALLEKNIVKKATAITTVSGFFKYKLSLLFKDKDIFIVPNGFDPEAADAVSGIEQGCKKLQIALVGTIYKYHPLRSFLQVINKFNSDHEKKKIYVNFYGINISGEIQALIDNYFQGMKDYIGIFPKMSNEELLKHMAENNLMLLFNYYSMAGTKIYDYLAIRRPILLCYSNDPEAAELKKLYYNLQETTAYSSHLQEDIIRDTDAGYVVENALHLRKILEQLYDEFQNKGSIQCHTRNIENYSRKHHASELADIIKKVKNRQ